MAQPLARPSGVDARKQMKLMARLWRPLIGVSGWPAATLLELWRVLGIPSNEVIQARRAFHVAYPDRGWVAAVTIRSRKRFKRYLRARRPDLLELLEAVRAFYMLHPMITVRVAKSESWAYAGTSGYVSTRVYHDE